jgi:hypothetical protein
VREDVGANLSGYFSRGAAGNWIAMSYFKIWCRVRSPQGTGAFTTFCSLNQALVLLLVLFPALAYGRGTALLGEKKEPLGSLSSAGEVYVNDVPASPDATIFSDDKLRTGAAANATFTVSGRGSLKILPKSEVVFSGNYLFAAQLEAGTVILSSFAGGSGVTLRIGDFVLVPSFPREQSTASKIDRGGDGSFRITCLDGSVGVLTLEGREGEFLHAGQSVKVTLKSEKSEALPVFSSPPQHAMQNLHPGWLGLGLAGAAAFAAELARRGGGQSVSPSAP